MVGEMVRQIKVREMRRKRYRVPCSLCWIAGPLPIGASLLRRCDDKRDDLSTYEVRVGERPYVIRRPCPRAGDWPRAGVRGWCFPNCQNCLIKRTPWAHPVWTR